MAENVGEGRGRRGRWLLLVALLVIGTWVVRSRRAANADVGTGWPPPRPADAGAEWLQPTEGNIASDRSSTPAESAAPALATADAAARPSAPVRSASATSAAPDTVRRPSPRPRAASPTPPPEPARRDRPPGAAASLPDGSAPGPEYTIKGNAGSMLFHPPESPYFARTKAQYWFRTAEEARAAGFTEWTPRRR
jgi:hypothetical protein